MIIKTLAKLDALFRPCLVRGLPTAMAVRLYSKGRVQFLSQFVNDSRKTALIPAAKFNRKLWGIHFQSPIFNAAGMFKNGDGYELAQSQGAGAFLAGTTTSNARAGNEKNGIRWPFLPLPRSGMALNWLGLPNPGVVAIVEKLGAVAKIDGCPIGLSLAGSPDEQGEEKLSHLVDGMRLAREHGVDFIEINESCPNTEPAKINSEGLEERLRYIQRNFLLERKTSGFIPVIVKFSNDTKPEQVPALLHLLVSLGFDGINLGNTSTAYDVYEAKISPAERKAYRYFVSTFGGGISGVALREPSLTLIRAASEYINRLKPEHEFHIIQAGGVDSAESLQESLNAGASLVQWYTGYFERLAADGHDVYERLYVKM